MAKLSIQDELLAATGLKVKKGEDRQALLVRIHVAVQALDDDQWKGLSAAAGKWSNEAATKYDNDKPLPEFPDVAAAAPAKGKAAAADEDPGEEDDNAEGAAEDETSADEPEGEGEQEDTTVKKTVAKKGAAAPAKKAVAKAAPAKAATKPAAKAKPKGEGVKKVGVIDELKVILTAAKKDKAPLTVAEIHAKLAKKFPDRGDAMLNTIRTQLSVLPGKGFEIVKAAGDDGKTYRAK